MRSNFPQETLQTGRSVSQLSRLAMAQQAGTLRSAGVRSINRVQIFLLLAFTSAITVALVSFFLAFQSSTIGVVGNTFDTWELSSSDYREHQMNRLAMARQRDLNFKRSYLNNLIQKNSALKAPQAKVLSEHILRESLEAGVDPLFVAAVVKAESTFRVRAKSRVGALGLMQILPTTGKYIAEKEGIPWRGASALYEPQYNIKLGIAYLKYLKRYFGSDRFHVLVAYNWGPTNTKKAISKSGRVPKVSRYYANKIMGDTKNWGSRLAVADLSSSSDPLNFRL